MERAERLLPLRDWAGVVQSSQLAVENFAKAVIAAFETPTWSHDPSGQLESLRARAAEISGELEELAKLARELAPEHGRCAYGEPDKGLTPADIFAEAHAASALRKARRAKELTERALGKLSIAP